MRATSSIIDCVSIHAPLARCDVGPQYMHFPLNVSIHAPTKGATPQRGRNKQFSQCFNPRTHEGCDYWQPGRQSTCPSFNPRTHEGCDDLHDKVKENQPSFNPRTHEGCDLWSAYAHIEQDCFNPRSSCEVRHLLLRTQEWWYKVSIHAPLARCDVPSGGFVYIAYVFQSTHLLRGATAKGHIYSLFCVYRWGYFPTDTVCSY